MVTLACLQYTLLIRTCPPTDRLWMDESAVTGPSTSNRGRGRGKSRGGLGKYLRARGRGRGRGRPAEFGQRLLLEKEAQTELDEEEQKELERKYARRQLGSNADRYVEPEPELDSRGEEGLESEVDLSSFLERQRLSPQPSSAPPPPDEDVDTSLARLTPYQSRAAQSKKGKVQQIEWDAGLEELSREKAAAEAKWDLKARFRSQTEKQGGKISMGMGGSSTSRGKAQDKAYIQAPPLPTQTQKSEKSEKEDMQDFLDDLLV
ncbi:hypothetical protein AcW1_002115 [Taiwanofungus camphoratus]|nr:hypothetical protein AcW1_002115 [Antrodia cinnamomea]